MKGPVSRNGDKPNEQRHEAGAASSGLRLEIVLPAVTTLVALLLGAGINTFEARRLERQKFEFDVLKYVIGTGADDRRRLELLCQFSDLDFIPDPDRRYHRAEIGGVRACKPGKQQNADAAATLSELRKELGTSTESDGPMSFEDGVLKNDGRVGDVRAPTRSDLAGGALTRIEVVPVLSGEGIASHEAEKAGRHAGVQLLVGRDGHLAQLENVFSNRWVVRLGLLTSGRLVFGTEKRGIGFQLSDGYGRTVPRSEGTGFHQEGSATVGRQKLTDPQLDAAQRAIAALCTLGRPAVHESVYVKETVAMSRPGFRLTGCR